MDTGSHETPEANDRREPDDADTSLVGRRVLITGASAGIGLATAKALVDRGARLAIMARTKGRLETAAAHIGAVAVAGDVADEEDAVRAMREATDALDGLDVLINNAGVFYGKPLEAIAPGSFRRLLEVNVIGPALMAREALMHLKAAGGGDMINISSTAGLKGGPGLSCYSASKFALRGMTQCWQHELRKYDIRVTLINPSEVQTGFGSEVGPPRAMNPKKLFAQDIAHAIISVLQLNRRGFVPEMTVFATNPWPA